MSREFKRTLDEINSILHLAKLKEEDIMPTSEALYFTLDNLHNSNFKFLQLDPHLMEQINLGETLYIKGDNDESVVLCSGTRTYDVVETETSNSLLLMNHLKFSNEIKGTDKRNFLKSTVHKIFYEYLEVISGKPHLKKLNELLEKTVYKGPEYEFEVYVDDLLSYQDLINRIQASEKELKEVLSEMNVVTINGKIRSLDFEYHFRVLSYMLKLIDEHSWALDEIDYEETMNCLDGLIPKEVLDSLFDKYATESKTIDGLQLYSYKEREICQFFAQVLLHDAGRFNLQEFLQAWRESVPEGMAPDEEMLYGIAIIDRKSRPNVIWAFPERKLPENINNRFNILFQTKEKWTVPEITPYIKRLTTNNLDANALLAKYARASKINGVKYYSAKHAK